MRGHFFREFDAGDIEVSTCFLQEEAVGAAQFEQAAVRDEVAQEGDSMRELGSQNFLRADVVGIAVGMLAGKIVLGVIARRIEIHGFAAA